MKNLFVGVWFINCFTCDIELNLFKCLIHVQQGEAFKGGHHSRAEFKYRNNKTQKYKNSLLAFIINCSLRTLYISYDMIAKVMTAVLSNTGNPLCQNKSCC